MKWINKILCSSLSYYFFIFATLLHSIFYGLMVGHLLLIGFFIFRILDQKLDEILKELKGPGK